MIRPEGLVGVAFGTASDGDPRRDEVSRGAVSVELGIPETWAWLSQVHGARVVQVFEAGPAGEADGVFTLDPAIPVAVGVADCLPVMLLGPGVAGAAHAGWKGAAAGVVEATIGAMAAAGHPPDTAIIGPGIGPCCFEVGPEVAQRFPGHETSTTWGTLSVDLPAVVADAVGGLRVITVDACTHHDRAFHSFRRTGTRQRQFGVAWIAPA
jgi:hypothetical protein